MDNEDQRKRQASRSRTPFTELNQVSSDFSTAMASQEQERAFAVLTTIESESSSNEEEVDETEIASHRGSFNYNNINTYDYFEGLQFDSMEADLGFLEGQDSNSDDDEMDEDDEIDVDELTYEELIALGEFIGEEKRGLTLNEISTCLHACESSSADNKSGIDRCVICQIEYEEGESVVALGCEHRYHPECISNWLQVKKICPICGIEVSPTKKNNYSICKL